MKPISDVVLADLQTYIDAGKPINAGDVRAILARMKLAEDALGRLVKACYPIDLWMGGVWSEPPSNDERHEFVLALSNAMKDI